VLRLILAAAAAGGLIAAPAWRAAASVPADSRVLIIGDSIATGMSWHASSIGILQKNLEVEWEVAVCRTLVGEGCPFEGARPQSASDLVASLASVPPYVVVEVGYNDSPDTFQAGIDQFMNELRAEGAQHVFWLTLRETRQPFPELNRILASASHRYPELELIDWNAATGSHPEWFQGDGTHLDETGGDAMAHLIHGRLFEVISPLRVAGLSLPRLRPGHSYRAQLRAIGGTKPYRWHVSGGRPPNGIHLAADGYLYGRAGDGPRSFRISVTDADGLTAAATVP
jgi:lysophospholipase L1-like esterase